MLNTEQQQRYARHLSLPEVGEKGQSLLIRSNVLVIGAGGLGCPLLQYLVAAGVGNITLVDNDVVDHSNLQRQILFTVDDLGRSKAEAAAVRLRRLNPDVSIVPLNQRFNSQNARELVRKVDLVIDGSDNFYTRYLVNDACVLENKAWVFGSVFRYEGQVSVFNYKGGPSYRCLFPEAPLNVPSCSDAGVIGALTGTIGSTMANEAIKVITGAGEVASGKLVIIDLMKMQFSSLSFSRSAEYPWITDVVEEPVSCDASQFFDIDHFTFNELLKKKVVSIDVREDHENKGEVPEALNFPLSTFDVLSEKLAGSNEVILFCESGVRSVRAAQVLVAKFPEIKIYNLKGGMRSYRKTVNDSCID